MSDGFLHSPFDVVREFLDGRKYVYAACEEKQRVNFSICGRHADYRVAIRITGSGEILEITGNYPFRIRDPRVRPSVSELLTRANYAMLLGKFEMDLEDGEVRFHLTQFLEDGRLQPEVVERLFTVSIHTMDRYLPAIMQHLHAGFTPGDAVFHAELDLAADQMVTDPVPAPKRSVRPAPPPAPSHSPAPPAESDTAHESQSESHQASAGTPAGSSPPSQAEPVMETAASPETPADGVQPVRAPVKQESQEGKQSNGGKPLVRKPRRAAKRKPSGVADHPEFPF